MRWSVSAGGAILLLLACTTLAKPGGHVTEERREYYQKTSQVIDTPVIYATDGGLHSFSSNSDALSSTWAQSHMDQIHKMADRLRSEYNMRAHGGAGRKGGRMRHGYSTNAFDYSSFAGKSKEELDALTRQMTESMISDMKSGKLLYSQIAQPNYFESQAAQQLESMNQSQDYTASQQQTENQNQQQSQDVFDVDDMRHAPQTVGAGGYHRTSEKKHYEYTSSHGGYQPMGQQIGEVEDMNRREEQSSIVYPTTVTIIGGKRYVTKKNCSTASSTQGSRTPYFTNYRTRTSSADRVLENGRTVPIVLDQTQTSTYNKESDTYSKTQDQQQSVPVYPGSYFTGDHYDSQYGQTFDQNIPVEGQSQSQTSGTRENSQYNRVYQQIAVPTTSQTFTAGSSYMRQHESQQIPVVIPTQHTITSASESFSQSEGQRQIPVIYPSSSTQRESSSYESVREHQAIPAPTTSNSRHSIYKHLQSDTETVPDYKPVVTIDSQTIDTMNEELNRRYQQRPSTIAQTQETEQVHEDRQIQQNIVIPDYTVTVHAQDNVDIRDQRLQSVRPTISTSQQTSTDEHQQSSVQYRPNYPAYGSQMNRNDTEFHEKYRTQYPQQVVSGSTYEKQEEDHYSREHQQQVPIFGQTSQQTEDITTSETYRNREHQIPVVVGGSTSYHEEQYTDERQRQVPQTYETSSETTQTDHSTTYQRQKPVYVSGGSSHTVDTEDQTRESTQYRSHPTGHRTSQTTSETDDTHSQSQTVYGGSSQHAIETEDQSEDSTRYRQYPMGHTQVTSETEDSYWSQHHRRPSTAQTSKSETETEYSENSRTQYRPGGTLLTQSSHEQESQSEDIRHRPGQAGYTITSQQNEATSSSSSGTGGVQQTITIGTSQETTGSHEDTQVVVEAGYGHSGERNDSRTEWSEGGVYQSGGSERAREQSSYDQEEHRQRPYAGGMQLEHSEYGSNVNRSMTSGGYGIGYITHQLTIEQQEEEWRRQQAERRRQQLISTGIFEESSLNRTFGNGGQVQIDVTQQGLYDGDEDRSRNGTAHLDQSQYGSSADKSTTSTSGKPGKIVSEDRGDQPPQHYEEDYDMNEAEPGIGPYPNTPQIANQRVETTTTPRYPYSPPYVAPLAPLVTDQDSQQTTVDAWPTIAGETEVQRTYHKKKTMITQTVPILLGANGEIIHGSGSTSASSGNQQHGSYQTGSSGGYKTQMSGGATLESDSLTQQQEDQGQAYLSESSSQQSSGGRGGYGSSVYGSGNQQHGSYQSGSSGSYQTQMSGGDTLESDSLTQQQEDQGQAYLSESSSQQSSGGRGGYGSSVYGSETRYTGMPGSSHAGDSDSRYSTGTSSSSASYQGGGSFSQSSAYGHQQVEDADSEDHGQQLQVGIFDVDDGQQSEDLSQQFGDQRQATLEREEELENLRLEQEALRQQEEGQSSSSYYQSHASYSSQSSGSSGSNSSSTASEQAEEHPPEVQADSNAANQEKPGLLRRVGQKFKDLFG